MTKRFVQTLVAIGLCLLLVATLGALYAIPAVAAVALALASGVYVSLAIAVGLAWPVVALAYVLFITRQSRTAAQLAPTAPVQAPRAAKSDRLGVEDP